MSLILTTVFAVTASITANIIADRIVKWYERKTDGQKLPRWVAPSFSVSIFLICLLTTAFIYSPPPPPQHFGVDIAIHPRGAKVVEVHDGSPAEIAGLLKGDIIHAINDERISYYGEVAAIIASRRAGDRVILTVEREGSLLSIDILLG